MSYEHVIWEQDGPVGRITLNRPDSLNSWTAGFGRELKQLIEAEAADASVSPGWGPPPGASPTGFGASGTKWSLRGTRRYDPRALPSGMPRRLLLAALAAALLAFLIVAPSAFADA